MRNEHTHDPSKKSGDAELLPPDPESDGRETQARPQPHSVPANEGGESAVDDGASVDVDGLA